MLSAVVRMQSGQGENRTVGKGETCAEAWAGHGMVGFWARATGGTRGRGAHEPCRR